MNGDPLLRGLEDDHRIKELTQSRRNPSIPDELETMVLLRTIPEADYEEVPDIL